MKKNLMTVLILALLIVNVILTAIMMFSVTSASNKTAKLVGDIAAVLNLELEADSASTVDTEVSIDDTEPYVFADAMTIPLTRGADGEDHYCVVEVVLSMNTKSDGYKTYGATLDTKESLIRSEIINVIRSYTLEEASDNSDEMQEEILAAIQDMFNSDFIFEVSFRSILFQ